MTDPLLELFKRYEAPLLTVEDAVAQLDQAVSLGDPLQVGGRDLFEGADHCSGDVSEAVPEVSLVEERDGAGVSHGGRLQLPPGLRVGGDAGDLVTVDGGVWTVNCIRVVPARLDVQYLYL